MRGKFEENGQESEGPLRTEAKGRNVILKSLFQALSV